MSEIPNVEGLSFTLENHVLTITFNRPKKRNALSLTMFLGITDTLNRVANDPNVNIVLFTGAGDFYSSGNDLSNFTKPVPVGLDDGFLQKFIEALINFPKIIVCAVNGPAIGIAATTLALCDLVYASETATFNTPFTLLGQTPEACSSYLFPKIMGGNRANEVLLAGRKLTAKEAFDRGLVTDVFPGGEFRDIVNKKVRHLSTLPVNSLIYGKALTRGQEKEILLKVNHEECLRLQERVVSDECREAVMKFLTTKMKSKL